MNRKILSFGLSLLADSFENIFRLLISENFEFTSEKGNLISARLEWADDVYTYHRHSDENRLYHRHSIGTNDCAEYIRS